MSVPGMLRLHFFSCGTGTWTADPLSWRSPVVVWATFSSLSSWGRISDWFVWFFSLHVAHTWVDGSSCSTDWEPLVSGYSASSLAETLLQGTILLAGAMLQLVYFVWLYLEVEVDGTVCYLADCLFWAQVLQVMLVDISGPNLPAMSHLAQLMPAKCKPWKCKIKPFLIIQQHLSLPGLPSFIFCVPLMEHH